jgi:hypothetical protein
MAKGKGFIKVSDSIEFKSIDTGGNSAGNGGDGSFEGAIINTPTLKYEPYNKAEGSDVKVNTGDHVNQKAEWDAGGATAKSWKAKGNEAEAEAKSNGDQESKSGHNKSDVDANTKAYQSNELKVDMHQEVAAGIGGDGGNDNIAMGGEVSFSFDTF